MRRSVSGGGAASALVVEAVAALEGEELEAAVIARNVAGVPVFFLIAAIPASKLSLASIPPASAVNTS